MSKRSTKHVSRMAGGDDALTGIIAALTAGKTVLTPNSVIADLIKQRHTLQMKGSGASAWPSAKVLPWRTWLSEFYEQTQIDAPGLLSQEQALLLWEQVVGEEPDIALQQVSQFTRLAADAWASMHLWQLDFAKVDSNLATYEVRLFLKWQQKFAARCEELQLIDAYQAATNLLCYFRDAPPPHDSGAHQRLLVGYATLPPLLKSFEPLCWEVMQIQGADAEHSAALFGDHSLLSFDDSTLEFEAAIAWAVAHKSASPNKAVAIALSNPSLMQDAVREGLRRYRYQCDDEDKQQIANETNLSSHESLGNTKIVQSAMRVLSLGPQISCGEATAILLDPYIGSWSEERAQRATLDREIRAEVRELSFSTSYFISLAQRESYQLSGFHERFVTLLEEREALPHQQSLINWQTHFERELALFDWPASDLLFEHEHAAHDAWLGALDALVSLSPFTGLCSRRHALHRLNSLIQQRSFNQGVALHGIRVMSFEQAALFGADAVAWCGLGQNQWPLPTPMNPLLPFALQRNSGMAGVNPRLDAEAAVGEFIQAVKTIPNNRFSFTAFVEDVENVPVRLFTNVVTDNELAAASGEQRLALEFDELEDAYGLALAPESRLPSAVKFFADQAACPFRAYAEHRLGSETIDEPAIGLDARRRGELVHLAIAALWIEIRSHARLQEMNEPQLEKLIDAVVNASVEQCRRESRQLPQYWALEAERLKRLLIEWLGTERERSAFEVVATEKKLSAKVANFYFNVRIDRIDRLEDGTLAIIDFKTGDDKRRSWEWPRLEQPQLPIYATNLKEGEVSAIAYAKLRSGESEWVDLPKGALTKGNHDEAWQEKITAWRHDLFATAEQMENGFAQVDPKRSDSCRYCKQRTFCRIGELPQDGIGETDDFLGESGV
ncbi:MAG: PD-(D/E)XK nuclease family protein [Gammaproteobacteria bacterium]